MVYAVVRLELRCRRIEKNRIYNERVITYNLERNATLLSLRSPEFFLTVTPKPIPFFELYAWSTRDVFHSLPGAAPRFKV